MNVIKRMKGKTSKLKQKLQKSKAIAVLLTICIVTIALKVSVGLYGESIIQWFTNLENCRYFSWLSRLFFKMPHKYDISMAALSIAVLMYQTLYTSKKRTKSKKQRERIGLYADIANAIIDVDLYPFNIFAIIKLVRAVMVEVNKNKEDETVLKKKKRKKRNKKK